MTPDPTNVAEPQASITIRDLPSSALLGIDLIALSLQTPASAPVARVEEQLDEDQQLDEEATSPPPISTTQPGPATRTITITHLTPGLHLLFVASTAEFGLRTGVFFWVPRSAPFAAAWTWDADERLQRQTTTLHAGSAAPEARPHAPSATPTVTELDARELLQRPPATDWAALVSQVSPRALRRLTGATSPAKGLGDDEAQVTTAASGAQDCDVIPGLEASDFGHGDEELRFLGIDLRRTWAAGAVGAERTRDARDRSGALERLVAALDAAPPPNGTTAENDEGDGGSGDGDGDGDGDSDSDDERVWGWQVLGEMQACFVLVLTLANHSCLEEWKRVQGLVLTCRAAVAPRTAFFAAFLRLLRLQLRHCDDVEGGLFELGDAAGSGGGGSGGGGDYLRQLLRGFRRTLHEELEAPEAQKARDVVAAMRELEDWLAEAWHWELSDAFVRTGTLQLEDGEDVELEMDEMAGEDERGEYAPVVVDL